jgi:DNA polymerase III subunit alpha
VSMFVEVWLQYRDLVVKDAMVLVEGNLRFDEFSDAWRIAAKRILSLDAVREAQARRLVLRWPAAPGQQPDALAARLAEVLAPARPGDCEVLVRYYGADARCVLSLGPAWTVRPGAELMEKLEALVGQEGLQLLYDVPGGSNLRAGGPGP